MNSSLISAPQYAFMSTFNKYNLLVVQIMCHGLKMSVGSHVFWIRPKCGIAHLTSSRNWDNEDFWIDSFAKNFHDGIAIAS